MGSGPPHIRFSRKKKKVRIAVLTFYQPYNNKGIVDLIHIAVFWTELNVNFYSFESERAKKKEWVGRTSIFASTRPDQLFI